MKNVYAVITKNQSGMENVFSFYSSLRFANKAIEMMRGWDSESKSEPMYTDYRVMACPASIGCKVDYLYRRLN